VVATVVPPAKIEVVADAATPGAPSKAAAPGKGSKAPAKAAAKAPAKKG
jgi:hypothetical protein